jgi:hypothetical protein
VEFFFEVDEKEFLLFKEHETAFSNKHQNNHQ